MKYSLMLTLLAFFLVFSACKKEERTEQQQDLIVETTSDTLAYEIKRIALSEDGCVETPKNACAKIEINYIYFLEDDEPAVHHKMNTNNLDKLRGKEYTNVVAYANGFLRDYALDKADMPDIPAWNTEINQSVRLNSERVICIATDFYAYTGGAHGTYGNDFDNYDRQTGELITLNDLFDLSDLEKLTAIGEQYFRSEMAIPSQESLNSAGYTFENDEFYLTQNFGLLKEGMVFLYGLYEIASYAQGQQEFVIPYAALEDLLKSDSVLLE